MGKSSLLVRTRHKLQQEGFQCTSVDLTVIGSDNITPVQLYKGIIADLCRGFKLLGKFNLKKWWDSQGDLSLIQKLSIFIEDVLFVEFPTEKIVIFIDEIDSILSLPFSADDLFAFIRFCYNQRASNPEYNRLVFAVFGVATPSDLINDRKRTPFNIGIPIELTGFTFSEIQPLIAGLQLKQGNANVIIKEILKWTNGQPFLTQKICQLLVNHRENNANNELTISPSNESFLVENIVRGKIINKWQVNDQPEHLKTIRDRILYNQQTLGNLLEIYQQILLGKEVFVDNTREHIDLILSGLIINHNGQLLVKNKIYEQVFNLQWIEKKLERIRPYSQTLQTWVESGKNDQSRLLRGQALKDAQNWCKGKSLTQLDYQYLSYSEEYDRQEREQALEAQKKKEIEARLIEEQKTSKLQRSLLFTITIAFLISISLGIGIIQQYRRVKVSEEKAKLNEVKALLSSTQGQFASNQYLDSLIDAIKAKKRITEIDNIETNILKKVDLSLNRALLNVVGKNRLLGYKSIVEDIVFSDDNKLIFTISRDNIIKIWNRQGKLLNSIEQNDQKSDLRALGITKNNQLIITGNSGGIVKIWTIEGVLKNSFLAHPKKIFSLDIHPEGKIFATASEDNTAKIWTLKGQLISTLKDHQHHVRQVKFSPNGKLIATASFDSTIKLWTTEGKLLRTYTGHKGEIDGMDFSYDSKFIVSGGQDNTVRLWSSGQSGGKIIGKHDNNVMAVTFHPQKNIIVSAGWDKNIRLWTIKGQQIAIFKDQKQPIRILAISPDGQTLASGSYEGDIKLWRLENNLVTKFNEHQKSIISLAFSPDSQILASSSWSDNNNVMMWNLQGNLLYNLKGHTAPVLNVIFSPDGNKLVSSSKNNVIKFWDQKGELIKTLTDHQDSIYGMTFSSDGEKLISSSNDKILKIREKDGMTLKTLTIPDGIYYLASHPKNNLIATSNSGRNVNILDLDGNVIKTLIGHQNNIWGLDWSLDGTFIASSSTDQTVKLWFLDSGKGELEQTKTLTLKGHNATVNKVSISPDSQIIASAGWDQTVKIWDRNGKLLKTLAGHKENVTSVIFSPDGKWLASGDDEGTIILWNLKEVMKLNDVDYACNWIKDYLHHSLDVEEVDRTLCDGS